MTISCYINNKYQFQGTYPATISCHCIQKYQIPANDLEGFGSYVSILLISNCIIFQNVSPKPFWPLITLFNNI